MEENKDNGVFIVNIWIGLGSSILMTILKICCIWKVYSLKSLQKSIIEIKSSIRSS